MRDAAVVPTDRNRWVLTGHIASRIGYTGVSFSKHPEADADREGFLSCHELHTYKSRHEASKKK